jgi:peptide deformylase
MDMQIAQLGASILRQKARSIDDFADPKFQQLIAVMQSAMLEGNGVGIAAPQLGESWQIIIVDSRPTARYPHAPEISPMVMVNPSFDIVDAQQHKDWEGCLSIPGIRALVPRYRSVVVAYQDPQGQHCQLQLEDFPARVFQHEYDHLLGMVFLDRVEDNIDIISESEFFKRMAA